MNPTEVEPMVQPSAITTVVFTLIVFALVIGFVAAIHYTGRRRGDDPQRVARDTRWAAFAAAAYLALTAGITVSGVLADDSTPPKLMLFLAATNVVAVLIAVSRVGKRLAVGLPLVALAGFQVFRLPLELVLHRWFEEGVLPVQMTYAGDNFDILSGVLGGLLGVWAWKATPPRIVVWAFNLVGLGLLLRVGSIAVLSSPIPIRQYLEGPAVQLALHVPYVWIVPFCVGGALSGHLILFRWLLRGED